MSDKAYPKEILYDYEKTRVLNSDAGQAAFLLGGIGTGNISLGARGELRDFEIFNHSGKGVKVPYSFFAIWAKTENKEPITKVLEAKIKPPYSLPFGFPSSFVAGLPRLDDAKMTGEYPLVNLEFFDKSLPVKVSLEAFNPFIPLNPDDSGIPAILFRYKLKNISNSKVEVAIARNMPHLSEHLDSPEINKYATVEFIKERGIKGLFFNQNRNSNKYKSNSFAIMTTHDEVTYKPLWLNGGWTDGMQDIWNDFSVDGKVEIDSPVRLENSKLSPVGPKVGTVTANLTLEPNSEQSIEFVLSWYFPNRNKAWDETTPCCGPNCKCEEKEIEYNYYSKLFTDAWDAGSYLIRNLSRLENLTKAFHRALHRETTLPRYIIDAVASNITVLRSPTCFRISDGTLCGWEGCGDTAGCCHGNCTHVWNYAQTVAFLFPTLEQSSRLIEFKLETDETGSMAFRTNKVFGQEKWNFVPAADGQMGTLMRLFREWKLTGDDDFLKQVWEKAKLAMDFTFDYWDKDKDFVLDSEQHNTYDIEFYGPNSLVNSMFYGALKAMSEMAEYLGETEVAAKYRKAFEQGNKKMDELLWGGDYYIQLIDDVNKYKYQYGKGCLSDQLLGQFLAHVCGLGYVLPEDHVKQSVKSIFEYNFLQDFSDYPSVQRTYVLNNE